VYIYTREKYYLKHSSCFNIVLMLFVHSVGRWNPNSELLLNKIFQEIDYDRPCAKSRSPYPKTFIHPLNWTNYKSQICSHQRTPIFFWNDKNL